MTVPPPPVDDADVARFVGDLGVPGLVDTHTHFMPDRVMDKVWAHFARGEEYYGRPWPIHYQLPEAERLEILRGMGVLRFAPLVYPHKPDMAEWLTGWVLDFAAATPDAVPTATMYPEPGVDDYLGKAVDAGARLVKVHVQVGGYDPRDPLLAAAWGLLAEAGVPAMVHCGHGPVSGSFTGLDVFGEVLAAHPRLRVVLAHAGMPDFVEALALVERYPGVVIDTTVVGTGFAEAIAPLPSDWPARLAGVADRVVLGTDFPNIPYGYHEQIAVIADWAAADDGLGAGFLRSVLHDTPARLLGI